MANKLKLNTWNTRKGIEPSLKFYPHSLGKDASLCYRKTEELKGTWFARFLIGDKRYTLERLGSADDKGVSGGISFDEAVEKATAWAAVRRQEKTGEFEKGSHTVKDVLDAYLDHQRHGSKRKTEAQLYRVKCQIDSQILPALGNVLLSKLTHGQVKKWRDELAGAAPRIRTEHIKERRQVKHKINGVEVIRWRMMKTDKLMPQEYRPFDPNDKEALRKRQATANRILAVLKAALNYAKSELRWVATNAAWVDVKTYRGVDVAKIRFLTHNEVTALMSQCAEDFAKLVKGALMTGCRYGELAAMPIEHFDKANERVYVAQSKNGESRWVDLGSDEDVAFFVSLTEGRGKGERIFVKADGTPWKQSEQFRPMLEACKAAKIDGASFHILRHTYASHAVMNGMTIETVAKQLGHKDTRITIRHYAHLSPEYKRKQVREFAPKFGF